VISRTGVLLVADLVAVTIAVGAALRKPRDGGGGRSRGVRLGEAAVGGTLIALVAIRAGTLPGLVVLLLVGAAILAAASVKAFAATPPGPKPWVLPRNHWPGMTVVLGSLIVVGAVLVWPGPTAEKRDTDTFGVPVDRHVTGVTARVLDHSPRVTDATVPDGTAVPVERYLLEGLRLTLVVSHNGTCRLADVLVSWAADVLDVVVVYGPTAATATRAPSRTAEVCRADPSGLFARRSALEVTLPPGVGGARVRDVGASGPALRRSR
jgi:hypothetical protein